MAIDKEQSAHLEALYREMRGTMFNFAFRLLENASYAEEAVQEAFVVAAIRYEAMVESGNPQGWLMKTVYNVSRNLRRSIDSGSKLVLRVMTEPGRLHHTDDHVDLEYADILRDKDFQLLKMTTVEGYSMLEAAEALGIGLEACKKRAQRARSRLQEKLRIIDKK